MPRLIILNTQFSLVHEVKTDKCKTEQLASKQTAIDAMASQYRFTQEIPRKLENPGRLREREPYLTVARELELSQKFWTEDIEGGFGPADKSAKSVQNIL